MQTIRLGGWVRGEEPAACDAPPANDWGKGKVGSHTFLLSWLWVNFSTLTPFTSSSRAPRGTPALSAAPPALSISQKGP